MKFDNELMNLDYLIFSSHKTATQTLLNTLSHNKRPTPRQPFSILYSLSSVPNESKLLSLNPTPLSSILNPEISSL